MPLVEVDGISGTLQLGGPGVSVYLHSISVGTGAASGTVAVRKGVGATGTLISTLDGTVANTFNLDTTVLGGVYVAVTGGAAKVSVAYD